MIRKDRRVASCVIKDTLLGNNNTLVLSVYLIACSKALIIFNSIVHMLMQEC